VRENKREIWLGDMRNRIQVLAGFFPFPFLLSSKEEKTKEMKRKWLHQETQNL